MTTSTVINNVVIHPAASDDFEWVADLMVRAISPFYDGDHRAHAQRIFDTHMEGGIDHVGHFSAGQYMFIAEQDGQRVGIIHVVEKKQETEEERTLYNEFMTNPPYDGMWLSIKGTNDDFATTLTTVKTYGEFSGQNDMRTNDVVDVLNYLATVIEKADNMNVAYPYLDSIDAYGHAFLDTNLVVRELKQMNEYAHEHNHTEIIVKIESMLEFCKLGGDNSHVILQFDGM